MCAYDIHLTALPMRRIITKHKTDIPWFILYYENFMFHNKGQNLCYYVFH